CLSLYLLALLYLSLLLFLLLSFLLLFPYPLSTLFPYTTLFRSVLPYTGKRFPCSRSEICPSIYPYIFWANPWGLSQIFLQKFFQDRKSTRLNSSHVSISYAVFCLKKKINTIFLYIKI